MSAYANIPRLFWVVKEHRGRGVEVFIRVSTPLPPVHRRSKSPAQDREVYLCLLRRHAEVVESALSNEAAREFRVALTRCEQQMILDHPVDPADRRTVCACVKQWFDRCTATNKGVMTLLRTFGKDIVWEG